MPTSRLIAALVAILAAGTPSWAGDSITVYPVAKLIRGALLLAPGQVDMDISTEHPLTFRVFPQTQRVVLDDGWTVEDLSVCAGQPCEKRCDVFDASNWECVRMSPGGYSRMLVRHMERGHYTQTEALSDGKWNYWEYASSWMAWVEWRFQIIARLIAFIRELTRAWLSS
jgi:hypothetical protein